MKNLDGKTTSRMLDKLLKNEALNLYQLAKKRPAVSHHIQQEYACFHHRFGNQMIDRATWNHVTNSAQFDNKTRTGKLHIAPWRYIIRLNHELLYL